MENKLSAEEIEQLADAYSETFRYSFEGSGGWKDEIKKHFKKGLEYHNQFTSESKLRWVKAGERLPGVPGKYHGKYNTINCIVFYNGTEIIKIKFPDNSEKTNGWNDFKDHNTHDIFWLEETSQQEQAKTKNNE